MPRCIAVVQDLILSTRIQGTARQAGCPCRVVATPADLAREMATGGADLVIVDLDLAGGAALEAIRLARETVPAPSVVAFGPHVDRRLLAAADAAGADEVMARSRFVQRLPDLLQTEQPPPPVGMDRR
jgi:DNA-binding NarL/FixJ family response regulator